MKPAILLLTASVFAGDTAAAPERYRVYFGTSAKNEERGIYLSELDMKNGTLSEAVRVSRARRPGFITIRPDGKTLYATGEGEDAEPLRGGAVSAFRILDDGQLEDINTQSSGGAGTCHVSLDPSGSHLLAANYMGGSCAVLPINPDGSLAPASSVRKHAGSSVHPKRQTKPYTHSFNTSPDGRFAFAADLGIDKIMIYRFDAATGKLEPNDPPFVSTEAGGGPRHFTFHPSGRYAFTNLELSNKVTAYHFDADSGALKEIQTLPTLPDGFSRPPNTTAEVIPSPDGRFLYVSNRGHDSITVFRIAPTGKMTFIERVPTRGKIPRNFNIDPTGTYLIAANQQTDNAVVFRIDKENGTLTFTGSEIEVPNPICIRFLAQ